MAEQDQVGCHLDAPLANVASIMHRGMGYSRVCPLPASASHTHAHELLGALELLGCFGVLALALDFLNSERPNKSRWGGRSTC
jgi:hypothetical protein